MEVLSPYLAARRAFLRQLLLTAGAVGASSLLGACGGSDDGGSGLPTSTSLPLKPGPLSAVGPLQDSGLDGIWIPQGFSVRAVARHYTNPVTGVADPLGASGYVWHAAPDGGAVYDAPDGGWVYVSNSETAIGGATAGSSRDGGVGALRFDARGTITAAYRILDGTRRNCAGGKTPWQTWLSCEETGDGQVYECDPFGTPDTARALPALGLFNHEAVCIDLPTRTAYLTEDAGDGRFYRFVADESDLVTENGVDRLRLHSGRLQVMNVEGYADNGYMASDEEARALRKVSWTDVVEPASPQAAVRQQRAAAGASVPGTVFKGGEGIWVHSVAPALSAVPQGGSRLTRAVVFFTCKGDNRVFAYDVDNDLLQSVFDNASIDPPFDDVDNLVVSPAGDVVVAEDGDAMRLIVVFPGAPARLLLQITTGGSELAGPAFTADGSRLYFSSQRGPNFERGLATGSGATYELSIPAQFRAGD